jgi:protein SCO1/2
LIFLTSNRAAIRYPVGYDAVIRSAMKRRLALSVAALALMLAGLALALLQRPPAEPAGPIPTGTAQIGGPFELVDENGRTVTDASYRGKWLLLFFGFTHCPDFCPTTLGDIARTLDRLGDRAERIQPLFVTVDPERDTPAVLAAYTAAFDDRIVGLTGTPAQVAAAASTFRIYFAKVAQGDDYTMDHSTVLYLMGPDGRFVTHFSSTNGSEAMARDIAERLDRN